MSSFEDFANDFYGELARVTKAIGNKTRLEILVLLAQGERTVDDIAKAIGLPTSNTSHHLHDLRAVGAVTTRKEGVRVFYRLSDDEVYEIVVSLCKIAEKKFDRFQQVVDTYLTSRDDIAPLDTAEIVRKLEQDQITLLDVRPAEEYQAGHVPGAINVPIDQLEDYMEKVGDREIVTYCRGPHCILAYEAVAILRAQGLSARRFGGGFPEWKRQNLPIESGKEE